MKVSILGGGSWGTALGSLLAKKGVEVLLWGRDRDVVSSINSNHKNPRYLSSFKLPNNLVATSDSSEAINKSDIIVFAIPSQTTRRFLQDNLHNFKPNQVFVGASKGMECESLKLMSEVVDEIIPSKLNIKFTALAGPSFAKEVMEEQPTAVVIAGKDVPTTIKIQQLFHCSYLRTYRTDDIIGAEVGGALKNVVAIATGIADGLGFGLNTKAALITRGLSEILRLGLKRGAKQETFLGLSGIGDLVLTCYGDLSRNRTVGLRLGKGEKLKNILSSLGQISEGVETAKSAFRLAEKLKVDAPIFSEVYQIIFEEKPPTESIRDLLERELRSE